MTGSQPMFGRRFAVHLGRLLRIYWRSPEAGKGLGLLALCVGLELGLVQVNVRLADAQRLIFDAVQDRKRDAFLASAGTFLASVLAFVLVSAYRIWVRQTLEMNWRRSVTARYLESWIGPQAYFQRELHTGEADNPDQRIAEDIRNFVASSLGLGLSLLSAVATLWSFSGLLWNLSADWPLQWGGQPLHVPGLMLWIAIVYAVLAMGLTHLVGRPLVPINFDRQRVEADFRYGLVRFRENVEAVALAGGAGFEQRGALDRFGAVIDNWWRLIGAQRRLTLFTTSIGQLNAILPVLIAAPAYFAGWLSLGSVVQTRMAYTQVSGALAWFVYAYQEIAQWRASVERLSTFADVIDAAREDLTTGAGIHRATLDVPELRLEGLSLSTPEGRVLLEPATATVRAGDRIAVTGATGSGKTTLMRALAGVWPYGTGSIALPLGARPFFFLQRPYLPLGSLRDVVSYPSLDRFADARILDALSTVGLGRLAARLDEPAHWDQALSGEEQQRVCLARLLLHDPDWVFLDDATGTLDDAMKTRVYELLGARLPRATVVEMTRDEAMAGYHTRQWRLDGSAGGSATLRTDEAASATARTG